MAAILVWVLALVGGSDLSDATWLKLGIVIAFVPLALRYARKNRPRRTRSRLGSCPGRLSAAA